MWPPRHLVVQVVGVHKVHVAQLAHELLDLLVVAHQAILRALYAYFANRPREDCPYLSIPLHTVIQLQSQTYGCVEMRFALPPQID